MKKLLHLPLLFILFACNNNKSSTTKESTTGDSTKTVQESKDKPKDPSQVQTDLETMTPLDESALKALIPEELTGSTKSETETSSGMGALSAISTYKLNDSSSIKIEIVDCAGAGGAGLYGTQYANMTEEGGVDDETSFKIVQYKGQKAFESCMKNRTADCTFTFFGGNRFLVYVEGKNTGIDQLKQVAEKIKFK